jgi:carbonic anhydrase
MDTFLQRNREFAGTDAKAKVPQIPFIPNRQLYVITCVDPRVDPADVLGLELGDAIVARNVGGRVTPALLQDLAWISYLHTVKTPGADWFEIAVIHHTDCGSALFADDELRHGFAAGGFDEAEVARLAVVDPAATVAADVARLIGYPHLAADVRVSGYAYDLETGLLATVVPPDARGEA